MSVPTDPHVEREQAQQAAAERRRKALRASAGDMVRSLAVILAIVAGIFFLVPQPSSVPRPQVDLPVAARDARSSLGFEPAVGVPQGWTVSSTRVRRETGGLVSWAVNYVTDQGRYVGIEQAAGYDEQWRNSLTQGGVQQGTAQAAGKTWTVYRNTDKDITGWLLREPARSYLVLMKAGEDSAARTLVESLRPAL